MRWLICLFTLINFSCIKSTISEKALKSEFKKEEQKPSLRLMKVGKRTMHFADLVNDQRSLIVFIHGSPGSWTAFLEYFKIDSLTKKTDLVSVDRPGFGKSNRGWPEPDLARQSELIHEVISTYQHPNKILVGHSLGGPVIARMAMDYPDHYNGLLFIAPSIDPEQEKKEWYRNLIKTKVGGWFTPEDFWTSNEEIVPLKAELSKMLPLWEHIKAKSIVLQGTRDMLVPAENAAFAKNMMKDSILEVRYLENVNHFIPWTHTKHVVKSIFDLLDHSSSE